MALFYDLFVSPVPISLFAVVEVVVVCWSFFICIHWGGWFRYGLGKDLVDVVVSFIWPITFTLPVLNFVVPLRQGKVNNFLMFF